MPNRGMHAGVGAAIGLGVYALVKWQKKEAWALEGAAACGCGGALVACIPDVIEPAVDPNHRGLFHSVALLLAVGCGGKKFLERPSQCSDSMLGGAVACASYVSHLCLDATTAKGLPLLGL